MILSPNGDCSLICKSFCTAFIKLSFQWHGHLLWCDQIFSKLKCYQRSMVNVQKIEKPLHLLTSNAPQLCIMLCIMLALNITFQMTLFNVGTLADHDQRIVKLCDWIRPPVGEYKIKNRQGQAQSLNRGPLKFRWFCKLGQKDVHFDDGQNWKKFIDHFCCNNNNALENGECCGSLLWFIRYDSGSDHFWEQL